VIVRETHRYKALATLDDEGNILELKSIEEMLEPFDGDLVIEEQNKELW
jgi:hypothetical protein